jgi:hypothetical protein
MRNGPWDDPEYYLNERERAIPLPLRERARHDAFLHLCLSLYVRGDIDLTDALARAALGLSAQVEKAREQLLELFNTCTCRHRRFVIPAQTPEAK